MIIDGEYDHIHQLLIAGKIIGNPVAFIGPLTITFATSDTILVINHSLKIDESVLLSSASISNLFSIFNRYTVRGRVDKRSESLVTITESQTVMVKQGRKKEVFDISLDITVIVNGDKRCLFIDRFIQENIVLKSEISTLGSFLDMLKILGPKDKKQIHIPIHTFINTVLLLMESVDPGTRVDLVFTNGCTAVSVDKFKYLTFDKVLIDFIAKLPILPVVS